MEGFEVINRTFDVSGGPELTEQEFLFALARRISEMLDSEAELNAAFARFKDLADKKHDIYDEDIQALISEDMDAVNAHVLERLQSEVVLVNQVG